VVGSVVEASHAVFLSYASQDAEAAQKIAEALRAGGIEVFLDQSGLRGGDAWDRQIRKQIHDCALFIPLISQHSQERLEGYFRLEWKLAVDRSHRMAAERSFIVPVVVDATRERDALVPDTFRDVQWTCLPGGEASQAFVARVAALLGAPAPVAMATAPSPRPVTSRPAGTPKLRAFWIPLGLAALAIVVGSGWFAWQHSVLHRHAESGVGSQSQSAVKERSIAVLPFVDLSEKHDQEYFADGVAEETLNQLAQIPGLKVIGRTSSFQFKGKSDDLRKIGTALGAAYVLEGSVRRSADRLRVTAQLINTQDGAHRWSETYDRPFDDVLKLQGELAAGVARAMEVTVGSDVQQMATASKNPEAYDLYLRGLHALDHRDRQSVEAAANYFQQALDLDASFAAAAMQLGRTLAFQVEVGFAPAETFERARRSLETAIRVDPTFGPAHAWLGWVHMAYDWDWPAADVETKEGLRISPRDPLVLLCAARLAEVLGHWDDAIRLFTSSLARDPLNPGAQNVLSGTYARAGR